MKNQKPSSQNLLGQLDLFTTLFPFLSIVALCFLFVLFPDQSSKQLERIRFFLGDQLGCYYLLIGLGVFLVSLYLCFSPYGSIRLGDTKKPQYSGFRWGSMMFTAGLAADILFYSCCEWLIYASDPYVSGRDSVYDWAAAYPLFHWGPVPWGFYLVLAVAFGFMLHVRKQKKQKYSEACRPLLGKWVDGWAGRMIDLTAVFALLAGTATTFSLATPLLSMAISRVTGLAATSSLTIGILIAVCCVYTCSVYFGMKGIQRSAACCIYLFFLLLAYVFFLGGETRFIVHHLPGACGSEFYYLMYLDGSDADNFLSPDNDNFLLGLLDGMVCGGTFFHRNDQQRKNDQTDNFGRLFLGAGRNLYLFYYFGQLWPWPANPWAAGFPFRLHGHGRLQHSPLFGYPFHSGSASLVWFCDDSAGVMYDHFLFYLL